MVTRPYQDLPIDGWPLLTLRLAIVLSLAALSYRFVELPIRHGALGRAWRAFTATRRAAQPRRGRYTMGLHRPSVPILSLVLLLAGACSVPTDAQPQASSAGSGQGAPVATTATAVEVAAPTAPPTSAPPTAPPSPTSAPTATAAPSPTPEPPTATPTVEPAPTEVAGAPFDPILAERLQGVLDRLVADGHIPGAVLAVQIPGQEPWVGSSGIRDRRSQEPMEPDTRVRIASLSKIFTSVVVLQLVEEGTLALDAPMSTWLPNLIPNGDTITVRNLLQHTSGLYDYLEDRSYVNRAYRDPDRAFAPRELVEYANQFPPAFRPGAEGAWDYASTNYVILGMIVEQATGNSLAHEMRARIFDPLELEGTFFTPDEEIQGILARGYSNNTDQTKVAMSFAYATANLVSTAGNVRRFADALLGGELLEPATLDQMLQFVDGKGQYKMPKLAYGLGIMRNQLAVGPGPGGQARPAEASTVIGHIGGFGGFRSAVWHAPESGITIALSVNQAATDPNILATQAFDAILTHQGR
jgi:D-alanyl-D-alanine carboxypeptidase